MTRRTSGEISCWRRPAERCKHLDVRDIWILLSVRLLAIMSELGIVTGTAATAPPRRSCGSCVTRSPVVGKPPVVHTLRSGIFIAGGRLRTLPMACPPEGTGFCNDNVSKEMKHRLLHSRHLTFLSLNQ